MLPGPETIGWAMYELRGEIDSWFTWLGGAVERFDKVKAAFEPEPNLVFISYSDNGSTFTLVFRSPLDNEAALAEARAVTSRAVPGGFPEISLLGGAVVDQVVVPTVVDAGEVVRDTATTVKETVKAAPSALKWVAVAVVAVVAYKVFA